MELNKRKMIMKREILRLFVLLGIGGLLVSGCHTRRVYSPVVATAPTREIVVTEAPPAPRQEVIGVAPSPSHVWVQGHWTYRSGRYVWMPGHHELRPRPTAAWVAGHWDRTSRGWVWTPGH